MSRVVIVGAGLAGMRSAEALQSAGFVGDVVLVGEEEHGPYHRPPLSKSALAGADVPFFKPRLDEDLVDWRLGTAATAVDLEARTVRLNDAGELDWDALVLATGVRSVRLPLAAADRHPPALERHVVRTIDDSRRLRDALAPGARLAIVGAGFIGCEIAATARTLGCEVHCITIDPQPMLTPLGQDLGAELRRRHESHGVQFHTDVAVASFEGDHLELSDGTTIAADVVVEAVGSRCNTQLLADQGFDLADGVLCDSALRPLRDGRPVDGIAVVGDLARFPNPRFGTGAWRVEHWSIPTDTGRRAGRVLSAYLSGVDYDSTVGASWQVLPSFWSDQYDIRLQAYGMPGLADRDGIRLIEGDLSGDCVVGYHRGSDLVGVVGLGRSRLVDHYRDRVGSTSEVPV